MHARRPAAVPLLVALLSSASLATVLFASGAFGTVVPAGAPTGTEQITSYRSDVTIEPSGTLLVQETIAYDFGVVPHHGIFRTIPVRTSESGKRGYDRVYPLTVVSVGASVGTPVQYSLETDGNDERIKIGDPDRTITGAHTYVITYRVRGALNGVDDHDELVWNMVGVDWPLPVHDVTATVHAPAVIQRVGCTTGALGSTFPCDSATSSGDTATFTQAELGPFEGLTSTVALPLGAVPAPKPILEERFSLTSAFRATPATGGLALGMLAVLVAVVVFLVWHFGRDRRYAGSAVDAAYGTDGAPEAAAPLRETETPVEFVPPDDLRPGQLGTLIDFTANPLDVTATVVDLAVRGYLKIEEVEKEWYQFKHDWKLTTLDKSEPLHRYERTLYDGLFQDGDEVKLSDLHNTFAARMQTVQKELVDDAMDQGWFARRPGTVKGLFVALGILVLAAGIGITVLLATTTHAALLGLPVVVAGS
jgi:hypothetical protein